MKHLLVWGLVVWYCAKTKQNALLQLHVFESQTSLWEH